MKRGQPQLYQPAAFSEEFLRRAGQGQRTLDARGRGRPAFGCSGQLLVFLGADEHGALAPVAADRDRRSALSDAFHERAQ